MIHTDLSPSALPTIWKFRPLVLSLLLLMLLYPYVEAKVFFLKALIALVLLAGIYAIGRHTRFFWIACLLGLPALASTAVSIIIGHPLAEVVTSVGTVLFMGFTTVTILWHTLAEEDEVTTDTLYGVACVYLLSGLTWSSLYQLVETAQPGSFYVSSAQNPDHMIHWSDLLFFSFVTLTTLGYGDIIPVTSAARSLTVIEAVFGVLYNAILIARLVGLYRPPTSSSP
jgi:hypothetical protein